MPEVCLPKAAVMSFSWKIIPSKLLKSSRLYFFFPCISNQMNIFRSLKYFSVKLLTAEERTGSRFTALVQTAGWAMIGYIALGKSVNIPETPRLHM